jgi:hypothetical protein
VILKLAGSGEPRAIKTQSRTKNRPSFVRDLRCIQIGRPETAPPKLWQRQLGKKFGDGHHRYASREHTISASQQHGGHIAVEVLASLVRALISQFKQFLERFEPVLEPQLSERSVGADELVVEARRQTIERYDGFRVDVVRARPRSLKQNFACEEFLTPRRSELVVGARRRDGLLRQLDEANALERRRLKNVA